jgi:cytochrome c-type biogenesis protein
MGEFMSISEIPVLTALGLGIATALSPCTFAANISGAAYICRNMKTPEYALLVGVLLSIGRIITYMVIGGIMIAAGHTIGKIALLSQNVGNMLLGIVLLIVGIIFLDIFTITIDIGSGILSKLMIKTHASGLVGALFLGMLFGLAFCPYSAALFFGMIIPLSVKVSGYALPGIFGLGVNVPVLIFTGLVYMGSTQAKPLMQKISHFWKIVSRILGVILISVSVYYLGPFITLQTGVSVEGLPYVVGGVLLAVVTGYYVYNYFR